LDGAARRCFPWIFAKTNFLHHKNASAGECHYSKKAIDTTKTRLWERAIPLNKKILTIQNYVALPNKTNLLTAQIQTIAILINSCHAATNVSIHH